MLCNQVNMMFVMLLWVCIHTGQPKKFPWPRWESNPRCSANWAARTNIPKVAGSIPTVARQTFQFARSGCTRGVTSQTSCAPEYITPTHTEIIISWNTLISKELDSIPKYHQLEPHSYIGSILMITVVRQTFQLARYGCSNITNNFS